MKAVIVIIPDSMMLETEHAEQDWLYLATNHSRAEITGENFATDKIRIHSVGKPITDNEKIKAFFERLTSPASFRINVNFLIDALAGMTSDVEFRIEGPHDSVIISDEDNHIAVIAPMYEKELVKP